MDLFLFRKGREVVCKGFWRICVCLYNELFEECFLRCMSFMRGLYKLILSGVYIYFKFKDLNLNKKVMGDSYVFIFLKIVSYFLSFFLFSCNLDL